MTAATRRAADSEHSLGPGVVAVLVTRHANLTIADAKAVAFG